MKLVLHRLPGTKRAGEVAKLVERLYLTGKRVVIWAADEGRRQILDDYLWTFRKLSFVPHRCWDGSAQAMPDPVVLVGYPANPNGADVLVVADGLPPLEWAATFREVHDFIQDTDEERWSYWEAIRGNSRGKTD